MKQKKKNYPAGIKCPCEGCGHFLDIKGYRKYGKPSIDFSEEKTFELNGVSKEGGYIICSTCGSYLILKP